MSKRERLAFNACSSLLMLENALLRSSMLPFAPFCSRTPCVHRRSFLDIPATACAHRRTCLQQPFHSSFITIALARKRLTFSTLKLENVLRSLRYHRAARRCSCATCRERFAWVTLNYMQYAPLLENALRSSSLVQSCNSLALIVALACNSPLCTHRPLIVPHHRTS